MNPLAELEIKEREAWERSHYTTEAIARDAYKAEQDAQAYWLACQATLEELNRIVSK